MILLVTSKDDLTTDYLILRLISRGIPFFRLNTEDLLTQYQICLDVCSEASSFTLLDTVRDEGIRSEDISGAYFRKPRPPAPTSLSQNSDDSSAEFNKQELRELLRSVWRILPTDCWLNSPENLWAASNKIKQLNEAAKIGLSVPPTLVSTRPKDVLQFITNHQNNVVGKAVKNGFASHQTDQTIIFTSLLDENDIAEIRDSRTVAPMILQPNLHKKFDLRITIVGEHIFAVAIDSQRHADTNTDWRTWEVTNDVELKHYLFDLPKVVAAQCQELNCRLGLRFSCIDMVLSPAGEFTFLEVNPNGQWAWIEQMLDLPIRDCIIDEMRTYPGKI